MPESEREKRGSSVSRFFWPGKSAWSTFFSRRVAPSYKLWVAVLIGCFYLLSNLLFAYGLDDSVNYINAEVGAGSMDAVSLLKFIGGMFANPPAPDSQRLFRPMRAAYTFLVYRGSVYVPFLPDLLGALWAGALAYLLLAFAEGLSLSKRVAVCAVVWFFGCIPVVAMGNVVLVCQFLVVGSIYLVALLYQRFAGSGKFRWLGLCAVVIVVGGLYAEAMLIAPASIGICGLLYLARKDLRRGISSILFALAGGFLVVCNAFLITLDPAQISRMFSSTLVTRGYDVSGISQVGLLRFALDRMLGYTKLYRGQLFSGIFFSVSPCLFVFCFAAFVLVLARRRRMFWLICAVLGALVWLFSVKLAIGVMIVVMALYYARRYAVPVSVVFACMIILGPIFAIDTHATYLLPALLLLLFKTAFDAYGELRGVVSRRAFVVASLLLPLIGLSNYVSGAYFAAAAANDSKRIARKFASALDDGVVLTNFRHVFDLYMYRRMEGAPRPASQDVYFTATAPLYGEPRAIRTEEKLRDWLASNAGKAKPMYFLVVDHNRLPGKISFHAPRFVDSDVCLKKFEGSHVLNATVPMFDPGFLFARYFYRHALVAGFIGYPIFPDMIDDVGVEYGLFSKKLFAVYRLFRIEPNPQGKKPERQWAAQGPAEPLRADYEGFDIVLVNGRFFAVPSDEGGFDLSRALHGGYSRTVASDDYNEIVRRIRGRRRSLGGAAVAVLVEEGYRGFNIISYGADFYGLAQNEGAFDMAKVAKGEYKRCVAAGSAERVKRLIDERWPAGLDQPVLVEEGYKGFNIILYGKRFFGLAQDEGAFDIAKVRAGRYGRCFAGDSPEQVKRLIDRSVDSSGRS